MKEGAQAEKMYEAKHPNVDIQIKEYSQGGAPIKKEVRRSM
ncbi:hypothetical protein [Paenibacillus sp. MER 180]|nr:hypothetical protein [Paenibacillus sp. MER 180]